MTRVRVCAAIAALLTALLVQATVISPVLIAVQVSLPLVVIAATALHEGPGTGIAFGFAAGLIADLSSGHAAGIDALCWMVVGLLCGLSADRTKIRRDALVATVLCTAAGVAATLIEALVHTRGVGVASAFDSLVPAVITNAVLAAILVPLARWFLDLERMRKPAAPAVLLGIDA